MAVEQQTTTVVHRAGAVRDAAWWYEQARHLAMKYPYSREARRCLEIARVADIYGTAGEVVEIGREP